MSLRGKRNLSLTFFSGRKEKERRDSFSQERNWTALKEQKCFHRLVCLGGCVGAFVVPMLMMTKRTLKKVSQGICTKPDSHFDCGVILQQ